MSEEVCMCPCHCIDLKHCVPCCSLTYNKYINKDGSLNETMYESAVIERDKPEVYKKSHEKVFKKALRNS